MASLIKRMLVGRPLATSEQEHQRIPKVIALAVFSSDAISSTAYAAEEILFVTALGASSLTLGLSTLVPIAISVAVILPVAVSISAGVAAIISIPAFRGLVDQRVPLGLALVALITIANLRG